MDELETFTEANAGRSELAHKAASLAHIGLILGAFLAGWLLYKKTRR